MLANIKHGKKSALSKELFSPKELDLYNQIVDFIGTEYEVTDAILPDQLARLYIFQNHLFNKLAAGNTDVQITHISRELRSWLEAYKLTPASKGAAIDTTNLPRGYLASVVVEVWEKKFRAEEEAAEKKEISPEPPKEKKEGD